MKRGLSGPLTSGSRTLQNLRMLFGTVSALFGLFVVLISAGWAKSNKASSPGPQAGTADVETVQYSSGGASIRAVMVKPTVAGKHPAVLIVHDNLGANDDIKDVAQRLAQAGFVSLAPDLLSRSSAPKDPRALAAAIADLPADQTVDDLKEAVSFLKSDSNVDAAKISSIGFGWGGWRVFKIAEELPTLNRIVVFYGPTPTQDESLGEIHIPIQAHYAQYDFPVTGNSVWTEQQFGKNFVDYIYPDTGHGFLNGGAGGRGGIAGPPGNSDAAKLAWSRMLDFLQR